MAAVGELDTVIATVQDVRDNIDTHHSRWFLTTSEMSQVGMEPTVPIHRSNVPADTPTEYYRRTSPSQPPPLHWRIQDLR